MPQQTTVSTRPRTRSLNTRHTAEKLEVQPELLPSYLRVSFCVWLSSRTINN